MAPRRKSFLLEVSRIRGDTLGEKIKGLKGTSFYSQKCPKKFTHHICDNIAPTDQFYFACARGAWVLKPQYVEDSSAVGQWLEEADYVHSVRDSDHKLVSAAGRWRWRVQMFNEHPFSDWSVAVIIDGDHGTRLQRLLSMGGARVVPLTLPLSDNQDIGNFTYAIMGASHRAATPVLQENGVLCLHYSFVYDTIVKDEELDPFDYLIDKFPSADIIMADITGIVSQSKEGLAGFSSQDEDELLYSDMPKQKEYELLHDDANSQSEDELLYAGEDDLEKKHATHDQSNDDLVQPSTSKSCNLVAPKSKECFVNISPFISKENALMKYKKNLDSTSEVNQSIPPSIEQPEKKSALKMQTIDPNMPVKNQQCMLRGKGVSNKGTKRKHGFVHEPSIAPPKVANMEVCHVKLSKDATEESAMLGSKEEAESIGVQVSSSQKTEEHFNVGLPRVTDSQSPARSQSLATSQTNPSRPQSPLVTQKMAVQSSLQMFGFSSSFSQGQRPVNKKLIEKTSPARSSTPRKLASQPSPLSRQVIKQERHKLTSQLSPFSGPTIKQEQHEQQKVEDSCKQISPLRGTSISSKMSDILIVISDDEEDIPVRQTSSVSNTSNIKAESSAYNTSQVEAKKNVRKSLAIEFDEQLKNSEKSPKEENILNKHSPPCKESVYLNSMLMTPPHTNKKETNRLDSVCRPTHQPEIKIQSESNLPKQTTLLLGRQLSEEVSLESDTKFAPQKQSEKSMLHKTTTLLIGRQSKEEEAHNNTKLVEQKQLEMRENGKQLQQLPTLYGQWMESATGLELHDVAICHGRPTMLRLPTPLVLEQLITLARELPPTGQRETNIVSTACFYLHSWATLHPPTCPSVAKIYASVFKVDGTEGDMSSFLTDMISQLALSDGLSSQHSETLLKFVVSVLDVNLTSCVSKGIARDIHQSLVVRWLWGNPLAVFYSSRPSQLVRILGKLMQQSTAKSSMMAFTHVCSLIGLAGECIRLASNKWDTSRRHFLSDAVMPLAVDVARTLVRFNGERHDLLLAVLGMFKPAWLRALVAANILACFKSYLLPDVIHVKSLSLKSIVSQYFFLAPESSTERDREIDKSNNRDLLVKVNEKSVSECRRERNKRDIDSKAFKRKNAKGETPIHVACIKNNVAMLKEILAKPGVNVNIRDNAGWTPLHEACHHGNVQCVELLLQYVPRPQHVVGDIMDSKDQNSSLPTSNGGLCYNKFEGDSTTEEEKDPPQDSCLASSLWKADVDAAGPEHLTPLHEAILSNHVNVCKLLLRYGGPKLLQTRTVLGNCALDLALTSQMRDVLLQFLPQQLSGKVDGRLNRNPYSYDSLNHSQTDETLMRNENGDERAPSSVLYSELLKSGFVSRTDFSFLLSLLFTLLVAYCDAQGMRDNSNQLKGSRKELSRLRAEDKAILSDFFIHCQLLERHVRKLSSPSDFEALQPQLMLFECFCDSFC